jgi:hypothetical protein
MNLSPEYFRATRQNYPAVIAEAKELHAAGYVYQPHRGNKSFLPGWPDLVDKPPLDIDSVFKSSKGECFNIGVVISPNPKGADPNLVVDIDLHGVKDQKDRDDCLAAKKRLLGDLPPTTITGSGGEHYHFRLPADVVAEVFAPGNSFPLDYEGKAEGKPYKRPPGEPPPRWAIEAFGPRHSITMAPSIHPETLRAYRWGCPPPRTRPAPYALIAAMRAERSSSPGAHVWGPRGQLVAALPPVPPFDPEALLPEALFDFCIDASRRLVCPIEYVAVAVLIILGSVLGATCTIRPKSNDNWDVAANLWGLIVGDPGVNKKTPSMDAAKKLLASLIEAARRRFEEETLKYVVALKTHQAKILAIEKRLKDAAKVQAKGEGGEEEIEAAAEALRQLKEKAPKPPVERRFLTNDPTVEKAGEIVRDNGMHGLLFFRDEFTGILAQWEREDHKGEKTFYLEAWPGTGSFDTDRIGRGRISIPVLNISLFGGMQPDMLAALLETISHALSNDGTLQRFQLLVFPDPVPWSWVNDRPNLVAHDRAAKVFERFENLRPIDWGAIKRERDPFPWFQFDDMGQEVFIRWSHDLRTKRIPNEDNSLIRQHLTKYEKLFPALALIFHLVDRSEGLGGNYVSETAALRAAEWCAFLEPHARRCYALLGHNKLRGARRLAERIARGELGDRFTAHEVLRHNWTDLTEPEKVNGALEWLEIEGWIRGVRESPGPTGGRPTTRYEIHPELKRPKP